MNKGRMRLCVLNGTCLGLLACVPLLIGGEARISETRSEKETAVVMENDFVRMTVDMLHGAKVTGFYFKPAGREWLVSGESLFIDHVWQQTWPGELYDVKYDYEILEKGPARVAVKVWKTLEQKSMDTVTGVKVQRVLSLNAGTPMVTAEVTLTNTTADVKTVGYWSQHIFRLGGQSDQFYIRPSAHGLDVAAYDYRDDGRVKNRVGLDFIKDPASGWTAAVNPTTGETAVFLMDYNDLRWLYNCIGNYTTEWYYDLLRMSAGREWKTDCLLLPLRGYRGVSFASREVVADIRLAQAEGGFRPVYTIGCGEKPLSGVTLRIQVSDSKPSRKNTGRSETFKLDSVDYLPREIVSGMLMPADKPVLITAAISGQKFSYEFEKHFAPSQVTDTLVAGVAQTGYSIKPPIKQKIREKPGQLRKLAHRGMAVVEVQGQFYPAWRLEEALKKMGEYSLKAAHFSSNVYGEQLDYFSPGFNEIMSLDAVVMNNVTAEAISPEGLALLTEYVRNGGGLLVLGGWYAFGGGLYAESPLAELLPVEAGKPFDIRRYPGGLELKSGPSDVVKFSLNGKEKPVVEWIQEVPAVKKEGKVVMTAGDKPFVVVGTAGKGRVACILAAPVGESPASGKAFFECEQWPEIMAAILQWLKADAP